MKMITRETYTAEICMAGDIAQAKQVCLEFCSEVGLCVTVSPTDYIYKFGSQPGFIVRLINYPRFEDESARIYEKAKLLGLTLQERLCQGSFTIVTPTFSEFISRREGDA